MIFVFLIDFVQTGRSSGMLQPGIQLEQVAIYYQNITFLHRFFTAHHSREEISSLAWWRRQLMARCWRRWHTSYTAEWEMLAKKKCICILIACTHRDDQRLVVGSRSLCACRTGHAPATKPGDNHHVMSYFIHYCRAAGREVNWTSMVEVVRVLWSTDFLERCLEKLLFDDYDV